MNNPFEYQNDLSQLNTQFEDIHNYYTSKMAGAKSESLIKKGQDLAKQSQDLASSGRKTASAVEEIVGGASAKKIISGIVRPGVEKAVSGAKSAINAVKSRFGGGGEAAPEAEEGGEDLAEGFSQVRPGVMRATRVARPEAEADSMEGTEGVEMMEGTNQGAAAGEEAADAAGDGLADVLGDAGADAASSAAGDALAAAGGAAADAAGAAAGAAGAVAGGAADALAASAGAVAASNWWNPIALVAGAVAVGAGIYSAVEAGEDSSAGGKAGKAAASQHPQYSPPTSFAGRYIVPVKNSLSAF